MPTLDAREPAFCEQYPNGCHTYDARGRRIPFVWPAPLRLVPIPPEAE